MHRDEFRQYLEGQFEALRTLNRTKGNDYTAEADALANLRDMPRAGITGRQKLWVYLDKHMRAIETYVREGQVESEPVETRIQDAVLYLLLFGALVHEEKTAYGIGAPSPAEQPIMPTLDEVRSARTPIGDAVGNEVLGTVEMTPVQRADALADPPPPWAWEGDVFTPEDLATGWDAVAVPTPRKGEVA